MTFTVNTATVPDTLPVTGQTMQIRGGVNALPAAFLPITWGNDAQNNMTRVGGDYWSKTMDLQVGDTLRYKYVVNVLERHRLGAGRGPAGPGHGERQPRSYRRRPRTRRSTSSSGTTAPNHRTQYFRPWTRSTDNFMNVYFRVSMIGPMGSGTLRLQSATWTASACAAEVLLAAT